MKFDTILYDTSVNENIAVIKLNRPHVLNAMNEQLWLDLRDVLAVASNDSNIKVVIITGEGQRSFSTGADLKESKTRSLSDYRQYLDRLQEISRYLLRYPKTTIAAVNGYALGSGCELSLACDIRIASNKAIFGFPEAKVASSVTGGTFKLLQNLIGLGKAKELLFTSDYIDAIEAERIGLVNKTVNPENLMEEAISMANKIAFNSQFAINLMKKGLSMANEVSLEALMDYEIEACLNTVATPEREEKLQEFDGRKKK